QLASQRAFERLGAKNDGVIRGHKLRCDGTICDTVIQRAHGGVVRSARASQLLIEQIAQLINKALAH
ncbi:hypothetical protein ACT3RQ_17695, partial [Halomonas sp. AOP43-D1-4]